MSSPSGSRAMTGLVFDIATIADPAASDFGGKAAGLWKLRQLGLPTPPAWVVPTGMFVRCLEESGLADRMEELAAGIGTDPPSVALEEIRETMHAAPIPDELLRAMDNLIGNWRATFGPQFILRSSATVEDSDQRAFSGIFDSIICDTPESLAAALRQVWASVFSARAFAYYGFAGLSRIPRMAVVLQPFLRPDYSGVMFTRFARVGLEPQVLVEFVEGDCEKLVQGAVDPGRLWLPRWPTEAFELPDQGLALGPEPVLALAAAGRVLEEALGRPQDVEWCLCQDQLNFVQTRAITAAGDGNSASAGGEILLQGVGASPGQASGRVHLVFNIENSDALPAGSVLTATMTNPDMVPAMQRSAAVVTDVGGLICHAAIVSRELGIPCVVGSGSATRDLGAGTVVTVDGSGGTIHRGDTRRGADPQPGGALDWSALWQAWTTAVPREAVPWISTRYALEHMPARIEQCVLEPLCDLALADVASARSLAELSDTQRRTLASEYVSRLAASVTGRGLAALYLDLQQLDAATAAAVRDAITPGGSLQELQPQARAGAWQQYCSPDGRQFARLCQPGIAAAGSPPRGAAMGIPLGFGPVLELTPPQPDSAGAGAQGMFGMKPAVREASMPPRQARTAMHRLIPALAQAHGGEIPESTAIFPWLDLRPEVPITPFLKSLVTPAVESIPRVVGLPGPPLHLQFIYCRFHFRQDTLFDFFPRLMQATWREEFLSSLLLRSRASYEALLRESAALPRSQEELACCSNEQLERAFSNWWQKFCEFFSLTFFIQAQGDDCVLPGLGKLVEANSRLLRGAAPGWRVPDVLELSAPVSPVLTSEYIADLVALNRQLRAEGLDTVAAAVAAILSGERPALRERYLRLEQRWYWMRERDLFYAPYDSAEAILDKVLKTDIAASAQDYASNLHRARVAIALHYDLAGIGGNAGTLLYGVKYGRALVIDREDHHIVWLRASYPLRKLILEWERRLLVANKLQPGDIFFLQPWEIMAALHDNPPALSVDLQRRLRNRRAAYECVQQLAAGKGQSAPLQREPDYY